MRSLKLGMFASVMALSAGLAQAGEIAVIVKTTSSNFWQNVNKGAQAAIEAQSFWGVGRSGLLLRSCAAAQQIPGACKICWTLLALCSPARQASEQETARSQAVERTPWRTLQGVALSSGALRPRRRL